MIINTKIKEKEYVPELTWDQMKKEEGVYQCIATPSCRFIVIRHNMSTHDDNIATVLYYSDRVDEAVLETAIPKAWTHSMFRKTDEQIQLTLK